jgi:hypothetical protein
MVLAEPSALLTIVDSAKHFKPVYRFYDRFTKSAINMVGRSYYINYNESKASLGEVYKNCYMDPSCAFHVTCPAHFWSGLFCAGDAICAFSFHSEPATSASYKCVA